MRHWAMNQSLERRNRLLLEYDQRVRQQVTNVTNPWLWWYLNQAPTRSGTGSDPYGHQGRLHQPSPGIVVVRIGGEPEGKAKQGEDTGEKQNFSHDLGS